MNVLGKKLSKTVTIVNALGLHARPAAMIAKKAMNAKSNIWLIKNGEYVDASSIIDILSMACTKGCRITLEIDHPSDAVILNEITALFEKGFDE